MNTSALVEALNAAAASIIGEQGGTWTGATVLRTVTAEETGLEADVEILYFRIQDTSGAVYWVDESNLDELTDEDMKQYI